ncbi:hypothetical protein [Mycolicibacter sinensis]
MTAAADHGATEHNVTVVTLTASGRGWRAMCRTCGWSGPPTLIEHSARNLAAVHYLRTGGSGDDDSAELAAAMRRHPAGRAR